MDKFALSVRQPWASLLVMGLKTIEIRSWKTAYRGPLLIHASSKVDTEALKRFRVENIQVGALIGSVELTDVELFTELAWEESADAHLQLGPLPPGHYAWHMIRPEKFSRPVKCKGNRGLFLIKEENTDLHKQDHRGDFRGQVELFYAV